MRNWKKKLAIGIASTTVALTLCLGIPGSSKLFSGTSIVASAETFTCGDFTVTGSSVGCSYANGQLTITQKGNYTIQNTNLSLPTTDVIYINTDIAVNLTLNGVYIDASTVTGKSALTIASESSGTTIITLADGTNNILIGSEDCCGIQKNGSFGSLNILADTNGTGKLTATGSGGGAGIGGSAGKQTKGITISGGTIIANGGSTAAGIGSGSGKNSTGITISGGNVTATGGAGADSIGGGTGATATSTVNINTGLNSSVKATSLSSTPTSNNKPVGNVIIPNPNNLKITIGSATGTPLAMKQHSSTDSNLYLWLPEGEYTVYRGGVLYTTFFVDSYGVVTSSQICGDYLVVGQKYTIDYNYENETLTLLTDAELIISNAPGVTTAKTPINVSVSDVQANIKLKNINTTAEIAINSATLEDVNVTVSGTNTIKGITVSSGINENCNISITGDATNSTLNLSSTTYSLNTKKAIALDNVKIVNPNGKFSCDKLTITDSDVTTNSIFYYKTGEPFTVTNSTLTVNGGITFSMGNTANPVFLTDSKLFLGVTPLSNIDSSSNSYPLLISNPNRLAASIVQDSATVFSCAAGTWGNINAYLPSATSTTVSLDTMKQDYTLDTDAFVPDLGSFTLSFNGGVALQPFVNFWQADGQLTILGSTPATIGGSGTTVNAPVSVTLNNLSVGTLNLNGTAQTVTLAGTVTTSDIIGSDVTLTGSGKLTADTLNCTKATFNGTSPITINTLTATSAAVKSGSVKLTTNNCGTITDGNGNKVGLLVISNPTSVTSVKVKNGSAISYTGWNQNHASGDTNSYIYLPIDKTYTVTYSDVSYDYAYSPDQDRFMLLPTAEDFDFEPPANLEYDGTAKEAIVTSNVSGTGEITVKYFNSAGIQVNEAKNAGKYTVKIDVESGTVYGKVTDITSSTWTFTITKATPDESMFEFTPPNILEFDNAAKIATVTPASGINGMGDITVLYNGSPTPPITAGTYTVTINVEAGTNYIAKTGISGNAWNFTIDKADPDITAPTAHDLTYNAQSQTLITRGSTTGGTMQYSLNNSTWLTDLPTATNAGDYTVYYRVVGDNNYNDVAADSIEITIEKLDISKLPLSGTSLTFNTPANGFVYNGSAQTPTGLKAEWTINSVTDGTTDPDCFEISDNTDAGLATVTFTIDNNIYLSENLTGTLSTEFTILPKPVTATVTVTTKTYDGDTDADVTVSVATGITGEALDILAQGEFDTPNAGTDKTVTINVRSISGIDSTNEDNYDVTVPETATGTILKATPEDVETPVITDEYSYGTSLYEIELPENWFWSDPSLIPDVISAGYSAYVIVDDENYDYSTLPGYNSTDGTIARTIMVTIVPAEIESVQITDIDAPTPEVALDTSATCETTGISSVSAVEWTCNSESVTTAFYGRYYTAAITLDTSSNYTFSSDMTATVCGNEAEVIYNNDDTVTIMYEFAKTPRGSVVSVEIIAKPYKLSYFTLDEVDPKGGLIKATYQDGTYDEVDMTGEMFSGYDNTVEGTQTVTVTFGGQTDSFEVSFREPSIVDVKLKSAPTKTIYQKDEALNTDGGMLSVIFENDRIDLVPITPEMVTGFDSSRIGSRFVTVTYEGYTVRFFVTVKNSTITGGTGNIKPSARPTPTPTPTPGTGGGGSTGSTGGGGGASVASRKPITFGKEKTWDEVAKEINALPRGNEFNIILNGSFVVPQHVMKAIADADAKVTFEYDSAKSWYVDGAKITKPAQCDLTITTALISYNVIETVRGTTGIRLHCQGTDSPTELTAYFKGSHGGKFANLYKLNENDKLEFVSTIKTDAKGVANLIDISEKGDYLIMLCEYSDLLGDVDNNGYVNSLDAAAILKDIVGFEEMPDPEVSDFNQDRGRNAADAAAILKAVVDGIV